MPVGWSNIPEAFRHNFTASVTCLQFAIVEFEEKDLLLAMIARLIRRRVSIAVFLIPT